MNDDAKKDFMSSDPEDDELNSFKSRKPPNKGDPYEISASEIEALISEYEDQIAYEDSLVSEKGGHPNYGEGYADLVFISRILKDRCDILKEKVKELEGKIGNASILLADWDGYYNPENQSGNAKELASLIEEAYVSLQGKSWRQK
jgi:hypothetical protein